MNQFWEWVGTDKNGVARTYQTNAPDVTEATMLAFLQASFPGLTFSAIKRIREGECKPRIGKMETHCFQFGLYEAVQRELGFIPSNLFPERKLVPRNLIRPEPISQRRRSILKP